MNAPGYMLPSSTTPLPKQLTLTEFLQTVIAGVSGLPGNMVRPLWQTEQPKQPDIGVNWIGFGIEVARPDANGYLAVNPDGTSDYQRNEDLEVLCNVFGPLALEICGILRDGFQIPQNRFSLFQNYMGFTKVSEARRIPDLVNQRMVDRRVMTIYFRRQIRRIYSVPTLVSAAGTIYTDLNYQLPFQSGT